MSSVLHSRPHGENILTSMDAPKTRAVAIFWDYENCATPSGTLGYRLVDRIREISQKFGSITSFKAYLEINSTGIRGRTLRSEIQCSGVTLIDCPHNGRKDVADKMMLVDMLAYAIDHPAPSTIVVISGDRDFAYGLSVLRLRRYDTVLITSIVSAHPTLVAQASNVFDWHADVLQARLPVHATANSWLADASTRRSLPTAVAPISPSMANTNNKRSMGDDVARSQDSGNADKRPRHDTWVPNLAVLGQLQHTSLPAKPVAFAPERPPGSSLPQTPAGVSPCPVSGNSQMVKVHNATTPTDTLLLNLSKLEQTLSTLPPQPTCGPQFPKMVPPQFWPLVERLQSFRRKGYSSPTLGLACSLSAKKVKRLGYPTHGAYFLAAEREGIIVRGGGHDIDHAWATLALEWRDAVTVRGAGVNKWSSTRV